MLLGLLQVLAVALVVLLEMLLEVLHVLLEPLQLLLDALDFLERGAELAHPEPLEVAEHLEVVAHVVILSARNFDFFFELVMHLFGAKNSDELQNLALNVASVSLSFKFLARILEVLRVERHHDVDVDVVGNEVEFRVRL